MIFRAFLRISDNSFAALDALIEPQYDAPTDPMVTGSAAVAGLVGGARPRRAPVHRLGADREPTSPPSPAAPAKRPLRVYVGLNSADEIEDRAKLLLDEMVRAGAFDRKLLVVATPTGTGWMDPAAMDTLEYLHDGDTAIVGDAVLLPDELDLAPRRARLRQRRGAGDVPHRLRLLDDAAEG